MPSLSTPGAGYSGPATSEIPSLSNTLRPILKSQISHRDETQTQGKGLHRPEELFGPQPPPWRCSACRRQRADNGILESDIQHLGRWSSQAYKGYLQLSQAYKFGLNKRFQTGRSIPIITTS